MVFPTIILYEPQHRLNVICATVALARTSSIRQYCPSASKSHQDLTFSCLVRSTLITHSR